MPNKIYVKDEAVKIMDEFENLLEEKGIQIPCASKSEEEDRSDDEDAANLYGSEYYDLEDAVVSILTDVLKRHMPGVEIDTENFSGGV